MKLSKHKKKPKNKTKPDKNGTVNGNYNFSLVILWLKFTFLFCLCSSFSHLARPKEIDPSGCQFLAKATAEEELHSSISFRLKNVLILRLFFKKIFTF